MSEDQAQASAEQLAALAAEDTGDDEAAAAEAAAAVEAAKAAAKDTPSDDDWRAPITSEDGKKLAANSPDLNHFVARTLEMRQKLSNAIVPPGKDAKPEDVAAYRKRIGVPESSEGYKFVMPEGQEATDGDKAFQQTMAVAFHEANVSTSQAEVLNKALIDLTVAGQEALVAEDKAFADKAEADLRKAWPGKEYDKNKEHGDRAASWMFGDQIEEVRHMQTKDGRFVLDHPVMLRALAAAGREMAEGGLVPPMTESDAEQAQSELTMIREQIAKAQGDGNTKEANRLFAKEQALLAKTQGNKPVVGAQGRAA